MKLFKFLNLKLLAILSLSILSFGLFANKVNAASGIDPAAGAANIAQPGTSGVGCVITGCSNTSVGGLNFADLNKTIFGSGADAQAKINTFSTPRGIISYLLPFLFVLAGLILFVMIIWGGFEMLTGAANPKSQEAGKGRITAGVIGFIIIFAAYWLAQLLQTIFGISILG
jgi:hypothetical protein